MRPRSRLSVFVACVVVSGAMAQGADPTRPLWGGLEPGPNVVGFRSYWEADLGRTYQRPGIDAAPMPRPILVNVWYPAAGEAGAAMEYGDYLRPDADGRFEALERDLAGYERGIVVAEVFGESAESGAGGEPVGLERLFHTPTGVVRDAPRAPGRFPLVLYHAGYGSSYEDNSVLCEYLASLGYVVVGSTFLRADGSSFNIDAQEGSARDLELLVRVACEEWGAEWEHIGMVGHSGGAHTAVRFVSRPDSPARAIVSLDTTQDYHSFEDKRWYDMVPVALAHIADIDVPLLFVARPHATFRMADRLVAAPRLYLTFRDLEHETFVSHGVLGAEFAGRADAPMVRASYLELCRAIGLFLDAELRGSESAREELRTRWEGAALGLAPVVAITVPVGEGPPAPPVGLDRPPTPREAGALLDAGRADEMERLLRKFAGDPRAAPLFADEFGMAACFQLVHTGDEPGARRLLACYAPKEDEYIRMFRSLARFYGSVGAEETSARFAKVAEVLDEGRGAAGHGGG
ncbi:MAG: hypothetical protein IPJ41_01775 [Phycisphaerales bacterium]|nr:hypothetical protein [Phycisphaerales bacterium]